MPKKAEPRLNNPFLRTTTAFLKKFRKRHGESVSMPEEEEEVPGPVHIRNERLKSSSSEENEEQDQRWARIMSKVESNEIEDISQFNKEITKLMQAKYGIDTASAFAKEVHAQIEDTVVNYIRENCDTDMLDTFNHEFQLVDMGDIKRSKFEINNILRRILVNEDYNDVSYELQKIPKVHAIAFLTKLYPKEEVDAFMDRVRLNTDLVKQRIFIKGLKNRHLITGNGECANVLYKAAAYKTYVHSVNKVRYEFLNYQDIKRKRSVRIQEKKLKPKQEKKPKRKQEKKLRRKQAKKSGRFPILGSVFDAIPVIIVDLIED